MYIYYHIPYITVKLNIDGENIFKLRDFTKAYNLMKGEN